ncbi:TRAP transporter small permease [Tropicimonas sp. IMCC34043]|uniref:TRAP transporter small permease n=1 Tax=Tropicimonas sp. IMCC34043 TaxID=2248760 RepID=UPI001E4137BF|nr:TRAP transporter small permease [Tropicimonas sp. IMCC34043]
MTDPNSTEKTYPLPVPRWLTQLCGLFAGLGGIVLLAMMLLTVTSVTLRTVTGAPISGDFELVEIGCAIAIFCFLPWCQIRSGNVLVDFFTINLRPRTNHWLEAVGDLLYLAIAVLMCWRLFHGGLDLRDYGEQSMVLRIPLWWSFVIILPAVALLALTCAATMQGHIRKALS